jgi:hypothetical protein
VEGTDRLANEIIVDASSVGGPEPMTIRCECGDDVCHDPVVIPHDRYEQVRQDPMLFFVKLGHELPEAEDIVETADAYEVVRKHDALRPILERSNPR